MDYNDKCALNLLTKLVHLHFLYIAEKYKPCQHANDETYLTSFCQSYLYNIVFLISLIFKLSVVFMYNFGVTIQRNDVHQRPGKLLSVQYTTL